MTIAYRHKPTKRELAARARAQREAEKRSRELPEIEEDQDDYGGGGE